VTPPIRIELVDRADPAAVAIELAAILVDAVDDGASVGFLAPLDPSRAQQWWSESLAPATTLTFVAREDSGDAVGVVQLRLVSYPNGDHRADVAKLLVHRRARGRGVAHALMERVEAEATARARWLLMLDTQTGSPAEGLYERLGWHRLGVLNDHARTPDGTLEPTTFLYKRLR
jgi:GNAT superfamily N-acetyltransferase